MYARMCGRILNIVYESFMVCRVYSIALIPRCSSARRFSHLTPFPQISSILTRISCFFAVSCSPPADAVIKLPEEPIAMDSRHQTKVNLILIGLIPLKFPIVVSFLLNTIFVFLVHNLLRQ